MSYDLMFQKAIDLQNAGALNEAEDIYQKILQVMPENSDVWNLLGLIAQSKGNDIKAVDCFLAAIKYAPRPWFSHYFNLALSYKSLNLPVKSLEAFKKACELAPDVKEVWNYLGCLQGELGNKQDAVNSLCKALEIDENYDDARVNLCYYTNDFTRIFEIADEDETHFLANFYAAKSAIEPSKKEKYILRAIKAAPERTDALLLAAQHYYEMGNFNNSLTFYFKILNLDENNVSALLSIADIYLEQKEYEKAEKYYQKSFKITTDIAGAHLNYGVLLYQTGRISEALEEYRKAVALNPDKPEISYNLALILKETGDLEEALGLMFNAHIKEPENQIFTINISETLFMLFKENAELALKIVENWQKQEPDNIFSARLLAAMSGNNAEMTDVLYSEQLFDAFADNYEETIAKLNPKIISYFKEIKGNVEGKVLDLGCGTGLAGEALKNDDNVFDGVDVSCEMLKKAELKNIYNKLYQQDILSFLKNKRLPNLYDLVIAFDVFCYLGDLTAILKKLKGLEVWFSVESAEDDRKNDYYLAVNGRYKHKKSYILNVLEKCGFKNIDTYPLILRKENNEDVQGFLIKAV